jgi:hypothetical protein
LDVPTVTAGLRRIRLVDPLDHHAQPRCLLTQIVGELPMWPLADLLIRLPTQTHPGLDITHIPHRDAGDAFSGTEGNDLPGRLMQQTALLAVPLRAHLRFALEQAFGSTRTHLAAAQLLLQHAVDFVAPVLA